jgi:hypothetical protein
MGMLKGFFLILSLLVLPCPASSDDNELAADLNEKIVQVPMVIDGCWGKEELQLAGTVFRPPGNGLFPLVVLNHGSPTVASDRPKIGR